MLRSTFPKLPALAALLLIGGCNLGRLEMDNAVVPAAVTTTAPTPQGHEIFRMFEAEKKSAAVVELPMQF